MQGPVYDCDRWQWLPYGTNSYLLMRFLLNGTNSSGLNSCSCKNEVGFYQSVCSGALLGAFLRAPYKCIFQLFHQAPTRCAMHLLRAVTVIQCFLQDFGRRRGQSWTGSGLAGPSVERRRCSGEAAPHTALPGTGGWQTLALTTRLLSPGFEKVWKDPSCFL